MSGSEGTAAHRLTEIEYAALCAACDRVLSASDAGPGRMAVSWLHVLREHPQALAAYGALFAEGKRPGPDSLRAVGYWGSRVLRSLRAAWPRAGGTCDVLMISHLVHPDQRVAEGDFYYGSLPEELAGRGLRPVVALLDHVRTSPRGQRLPSVRGVERLLVPTIGPVRHECQALAELLRERRALVGGSPTDMLDGRVRRAAARHALAPASADALAIAAAIGALVAARQPRALVTTFEGHAWERLVYQAARRARPGIRCIGYQHALVSPRQHALRRLLGHSFDPDVVLTSGPSARARLVRDPAFSHVDVWVLGSDRAAHGDALVPRPSRETCLVVPEGLPDECQMLLTFSLAAAHAVPTLRFVWRLHPLLSMQELERRYPALRERPPNIEISTRALSADVAEATHVLYRGSTAVIPAAAVGSHPIYLHRDGEMRIDPLHEASTGRDVITDVAGFRYAVARVRTADEIADVQAVCNGLFAPLDVEVLVQAIGGRSAAADSPLATTVPQ